MVWLRMWRQRLDLFLIRSDGSTYHEAIPVVFLEVKISWIES